MQQLTLVTGGSSGVGRSVVTQLARRQHGVVFTYRTRAAEAEALVAELEAAGSRAAALPLDVADVASHAGFVARLRAVLRERWQRDDLDALVNNAGVGGGAPLAEVTEAFYERLFATNFKGPFFLTQQLVPLLRDGGAIVNVSSSAARATTTTGYSVYGATKAALTAVTRYLAKELAPRGIRVNSVSPGPIFTNFGLVQHPEFVAPLAAQQLFGRVAQPEDVGDAICALLSDDCRFVTATDLDVSGGFMV